MSDSETQTANSSKLWIAIAAVVLGGAAIWGIRSLSEAPPTPETEMKSPGERAIAASGTSGSEGTNEAATSTGATTSTPPDPTARLHLETALQLEREGRLDEARRVAQQAIDAGMGRDALLLAAKLALLEKDADAAVRPLETILRESPDDADALYNLGLAWQQHSAPNYNKARNNYLAALRAEPRYAAARYNLVILCLEHGVMAEAQHHFDKFVEEWPKDPRLPALRTRMEATRGGMNASGGEAN